jgi:hypothetical protein
MAGLVGGKATVPVRGALQSAAAAVEEPLERAGVGARGSDHQPPPGREKASDLTRG